MEYTEFLKAYCSALTEALGRVKSYNGDYSEDVAQLSSLIGDGYEPFDSAFAQWKPGNGADRAHMEAWIDALCSAYPDMMPMMLPTNVLKKAFYMPVYSSPSMDYRKGLQALSIYIGEAFDSLREAGVISDAD